MDKQQILRIALIPALVVTVAIFAYILYAFDWSAADTADEVVHWSVEGEYDDRVELEVARTRAQHRTGVSEWEEMYHVSNTPDKAQERGMLFELGELQTPVFWMKGVEFPLDMIWLQGSTIVDITKRVQPEPGVPDEELTLYSPSTEVNRVIEVRGGFADAYGIEIGDTIELR